MKTIALKLIVIITFLIFVSLISVCSISRPQIASFQKAGVLPEEQLRGEPIHPLPTDIVLNDAKVALGEALFNDTKLSHNNTISCASCHSLEMGGTDRRTFSAGMDENVGKINSPTVFNASLNFKQFWDGRADTLEEQIDGPIHASDEMRSEWNEVTNKLLESPEYVAAFSQLYPNGIEAENIKDAIAEFERSLTTPNSRFDKFLRGDDEILTQEEKDGYRTFKSVGCISCHQGINIGGNLFQEFGVMGNYFKDRGNITNADLGRYNVTHKEDDKHVFKVPGLRNISQTYPYFHDGSAKTLENAVSVMSKYQLGRRLTPKEIETIVKFLRTLDGEYTRSARR